MHCLIALDLQKDAESGAHVQSILPQVKRLIDAARASGVPVIYVCDMHRPTDRVYFQLSGLHPHCMVGTEGAEVIDRIRPADGDLIVRKRNLSGFFGTDLEVTLRGMEADRVILIGASTNGCILHTAADAYQRYYQVTVVEDATDAKSGREDHQFSLRHLRNIVKAEILNTEEAIRKYLTASKNR